MQLPSFFIKRPVFACVLSAMIVAVGLASFKNLSVREYPDVPLPRLSVQTFYPNASADLVETKVTSPLEDSLASVSGLVTMGSDSGEGMSTITLHFKPGEEVDAKIVAVRDAIEKVRASLPKDVLSPTILRGSEQSGPPFIAITFSSDHLSPGELTHLVNVRYKNIFRSLSGVASAEVWSPPFAMEVMLDPKQLYGQGMNIADVMAALEAKKEGFPSGKLHDAVPVTLMSELRTEDDFRNLVIRPAREGQKPVLLSQLAQVSESLDDSHIRILVNGKPGTIIAIKLASDANPLEVSNAVRTCVARMQATRPEGLLIDIDVDNADFIRASLGNIQKSLVEAFCLVFAIIFLFMRNVRACLVPLVTIPISLIGVLGVFLVCGLSINIITMLAVILAIGLVVDDAIVVLENIQRHIEEGKTPWQAALVGSKEIGFAVVAMTLTLASVYAPIGFLQSTMGFLFREFAIALAGAVIISGVISLTLCPMLCARLLKEKERVFFPQFDVFLGRVTAAYEGLLRLCFAHKPWVFGFMGASFAASLMLSHFLPQEMAPPEDRGLLGAYAPQVPGKGIDAQVGFAKAIEERVKDIPEAAQRLSFVGSWGASVALRLKDWGERSRSAAAITEQIRGRVADMPSLDVMAWDVNSGLPGVEVGTSNGLKMALKTNASYNDLNLMGEKLIKALQDTGLFTRVSQSLFMSAPSWRVVVDTYAQGLFDVEDRVLSQALSVSLSKDNSLTYLKENVPYPVLVKTNTDPEGLSELYVTNSQGQRTSLESLASFVRESRAANLMHHDQMRATIVEAEPKEGVVMGNAMEVMEKTARRVLTKDFSTDWTGTTREFLDASAGTTLLFGLSLFFIFSILAIQFESVRDPLIIILTVPLASFGALLLLWATGGSLNIYTKIGLVTLVGLITKHGILLVEMAGHLHREGETWMEAAVGAARLRLRPILMTTGAMVFGVIPLALDGGAGAEARRAIGATLLGGLLLGTLTTLFVIPVIYSLKGSDPHAFKFWKKWLRSSKSG
ncbi:MAG: AcrB/AcrD/AcrF family protein [Candidatus Puniceispirillum sp.]|nr:AcrB/AcrD/AcrF family protein [Candidatus Puniceispirillum sp.]